MKRILLICVILTSWSISFAQEIKVEDSYPKYFELPRETLFLHTNKTTYIIGESEEIWFTAYAYDRKNRLSSKTTSNIHIGLYDSNGKQLLDKLFYAKNGIATGNLEIDPSFSTGDYYLKIHTEWMKNFKEDDAFIQKIRLINPKNMESDKERTNSVKEYDIQFLPEGGNLLSGVRNSVGIKALDDFGKGTKLTGAIVDSKGEQVAIIRTNFLGLGKVVFTPKFGETYKAKVTLNNSKELVLDLPKSEKEGIILSVNNLRKYKVIIDVTTNNSSFLSLRGKEYKILIHQNGVAKIIKVVMNNFNERVVIDKNLLFKGVNTVTLFKENTPLAERMFFNDTGIKKYSLTVDKIQSDGDSLNLHINNNLKDSTTLSASISILPKETKSYNPRHSIISAFYLKPYLKGVIENPRYYFDEVNQKKRYELDLLLLTQGWSRYSWDDIFKNPPKMNFAFERGIKTKGRINNQLGKNNSLLLLPTKNNPSRFVKFDQNGQFEIDNFFPEVGEQIEFSFVNKKGKAKRPKMVVSSLMNWQTDSINTSPFQEKLSFYSDKNSIPLNFLNKNEVLDEIVIEARLNRVFKKRGPKFKGSIIKITDSVAKQNVIISQVLNKEKFQIEYDGPDMKIVAQEKISRGSPRPVVFFIDGIPINNMHNFLTTNTAEFEDVYIDYSYNRVNAVQMGEMKYLDRAIIVNLFSRISPFDDPNMNGNTTIHSVLLKHGFSPTKEFYTPRYIDYTIDAFKEYGVIHWEPNISLKTNTSDIIRTLDTGLKNITLFIEGMTSDGNVFSQVINTAE